MPVISDPLILQSYFEFGATRQPDVAPTGKTRLWWDQSAGLLKMSVSGGAFAELPSLVADGITAADLLTAIADGAFAADAATRALFGDGIWTTAKLAAGVLSADATGRALIASDYFDAATVLLKIADNAFAADAATRALFVDGIWTQAKLAAASLDGTVAAVGANANVIGALPVIHRIDLAAGALGDTDVVLTHKTRVIDAYLVLRGAGVANTTLQVKNGATAITNAMAASGTDQALVRAATLDDAAWEIAAAGTLRVTSATGATQPEATVFVTGIRVA